MLMMMLLMRLMRRVVISADDPWMKSLLLRMLRGQTPQVRLLMLLPHVVHFEVHLSRNKYTSSSKGEKAFSHPSAGSCTFARRSWPSHSSIRSPSPSTRQYCLTTFMSRRQR